MSIVIPEIEVRPGTHCLFASLRRLLLFAHGANMSEAEIYFRCDGLNVEYDPASRPFWIGRSGDGMLSDFNRVGPVRLRYSFDMDQWPSKRKLLDELASELAAGKPVMLFAYSGSLTYHAIYRENPSRPHVVFLYGMDEPNGSFYIGDSFLLDYSGAVHTYQGVASINDVSKGTYGVSFLTDRQPSFFQKENDIAVVLHERVDKFLNNRMQGGNGEPTRGLQAYHAFFDWLESAADLDKESFADICKEAYYCLRIGSIMHQWTYFLDIVNECPASLRHGPDYWTEKLLPELMHWRKHLLNMYKAGLRSDQASWPSILNKSRQLLERQAQLLHHFVDDLRSPLLT